MGQRGDVALADSAAMSRKASTPRLRLCVLASLLINIASKLHSEESTYTSATPRCTMYRVSSSCNFKSAPRRRFDPPFCSQINYWHFFPAALPKRSAQETLSAGYVWSSRQKMSARHFKKRSWNWTKLSEEIFKRNIFEIGYFLTEEIFKRNIFWNWTKISEEILKRNIF